VGTDKPVSKPTIGSVAGVHFPVGTMFLFFPLLCSNVRVLARPSCPVHIGDDFILRSLLRIRTKWERVSRKKFFAIVLVVAITEYSQPLLM
jgi:hypothetical protein